MVYASAGALFSATRALMPVALVGALLGRRADRGARNRTGADEPPASSASAPARLTRRQLRSRVGSGADLRELDLTGAHLRKAGLRSTSFDGSVLVHTDLSDTDLRGATFADADLADCDLTRADLRGADLSRARNAGAAWLRAASYDATTRWPPGFDPRAAGAVAARSPARPSGDTTIEEHTGHGHRPG